MRRREQPEHLFHYSLGVLFKKSAYSVSAQADEALGRQLVPSSI